MLGFAIDVSSVPRRARQGWSRNTRCAVPCRAHGIHLGSTARRQFPSYRSQVRDRCWDGVLEDGITVGRLSGGRFNCVWHELARVAESFSWAVAYAPLLPAAPIRRGQTNQPHWNLRSLPLEHPRIICNIEAPLPRLPMYVSVGLRAYGRIGISNLPVGCSCRAKDLGPR